jgi:streptogramin lyase
MFKLKKLLNSFSLLIIIAVWFSAIEVSAADYNYILQWNFGGGNIYGLTTDNSGNVYFAHDYTVFKLNNHLNILTQWGTFGTGNGQFNDAMRPAIDASGNVYVPDLLNSRIQKFDSNGNYLTQWGTFGSAHGQFNYPYSAAVDKNGYVYVLDQGNSRIEKFDTNGNYVMTIGANGNDLAIDLNGNIFVTQNIQIAKYSSSGNLLTSWGSQGSGNGQFDLMIGIAVDKNGNVFVADAHNSRIQKFDNNGNFLTTWGTYGSSPGQFNGVGYVAVDNSGYVYTGEREGTRIQKFAPPVATPVGGAGMSLLTMLSIMGYGVWKSRK